MRAVDGFGVGAWAALIGIIVALFTLDLLVAVRRPHAVGLAEATVWSVFYIAVAVGFGLGLWAVAGGRAGTEYFAGWVVEKSLSVDNLFIFSIIFGRFAVPAQYRQKILLYGIAFALVLRSVFIAIGAAAINLFSFTFLLFGLVLLWTALQLIRHRNEQPDVTDTWLVRRVRTIMPVSTRYHGARLLTVEDGRRIATPVLLVFLAIGSTDLLFALDSIPAVFGVTSEPFLVFAANAFALLGLRALFFLIEGLLERLIYLSIGLALILALIGVKLILLFLHQDITQTVPELPTPISLGLILLILIATTIASMLRARAHPEQRAHPGAIHIHRNHSDDNSPPPGHERQRPPGT